MFVRVVPLSALVGYRWIRRVAAVLRWLALGLTACAAGFAQTPEVATPPLGLPFIRTYSLDEIGDVPRTLRLGFDEFGRIATMYDGVYSVLNDSAWVNLIDRKAPSRARMTRIVYTHGRYYYAGRGSWGRVERSNDGHFIAQPLVPEGAPPWTRIAAFNTFLATANGAYILDINGIVHWDFEREQSEFFPLPRLVSVFAVGERVFASGEDNHLREILAETHEHRTLELEGLIGQNVRYAAALDPTHTLLALSGGSLVMFDGQSVRPWAPLGGRNLQGKITAMASLKGGGVAVAVAEEGVYLFPAGKVEPWPLLIPEFRLVTEMASGEPGVLWVAGKNAVHRIYYDSPLTSFGLQDGHTVAWPVVTQWKKRVVVAAGGQLFLSQPNDFRARPGLQRITTVPARTTYQVASRAGLLLAGNGDGAFSIAEDFSIQPVADVQNISGIEFLDDQTCLVIGAQEIAALRYSDGHWSECAPRIPGVGDAPVRFHRGHLLWIEMGGDRVAYLKLQEGELKLRRLALPWSETQWTNVGAVGATIVLSGATGFRAFFDEAKEDFVDAPALDRLLRRSPYWISRIKEDSKGVLWASHPTGVVTFTPKGDDYELDTRTFELRNDSYPAVTILPGDQVWLGAARVLYHVEPWSQQPRPPLAAKIVSLIADQAGVELLATANSSEATPRFDFENNSLSFRFFSGTYAWRSPPSYEYRLSDREAWTAVDPSLILRFPKLRDGAYHLEVRNTQARDGASAPLSFAFVINPPWYRSPSSYVVYGLLVVLAIIAVARWMNHRSFKHNNDLQRLVHERTHELEEAMNQLEEKSRNEATLAERSRLAGEIHDSIQQGLSGSIMHLDTTMNHPSLTSDLHAKLNVVRNMLAYSREEVQQAVWNLGSPLLQNSNLGDALRKIAGYISSGTTAIDVEAPEESIPLAPAIRHNLLRIAQEAITNAVKHAEATHIHVVLENQPLAVVLTVTDDGKGFDPSKSPQAERHFGLRGLKARVRAIKADLNLSSSPGAGTSLRVTVPHATNLKS